MYFATAERETEDSRIQVRRRLQQQRCLRCGARQCSAASRLSWRTSGDSRIAIGCATRMPPIGRGMRIGASDEPGQAVHSPRANGTHSVIGLVMFVFVAA
jgi:hypothetical protein